MKNLLNKGYRLYIDNYYTKVNLLLYLYENETYVTGTARVDRSGFSKSIIYKSKRGFPRGSNEWRMNEPILAQVWMDSKPVNFLTTLHRPVFDDATPDNQRIVKRKGKKGERQGIEVSCLPCVRDYNQNMGGVDLSDQMMKYYNRKSKKWYSRVFYHLLELCIHNGFILENCFLSADESKARNHKNFRQELITQLIGNSKAPRIQQQANERMPLLFWKSHEITKCAL